MNANGAATTRPLAILHTENSLAWGGQEVRILTESAGLIGRGHRVELLVCPDAPIGRAAERLGVPVHYADIGAKRPREFATMRRWLARHARRFDVINTHSSTDSWLAAVARASLAVGRGAAALPPLVRTRHVSTPVNRQWTTRWLYLRGTQHVVTTGEALRQQLHRDNGVPLARMTSVRTGIDLARYRPRDRTRTRRALGVDDRPTLGILATLRSWKGHADLLDAFASLRAAFPSWRLLVVGDGPQRDALRARVAALDLADAVRFVGNVDNADEWLATFDAAVLPSYGDEGVPQSLMQAMATGLAVVSTPVGAIREAVDAGVTGLLVAPRDPPALAAALATLMGDDGLRRRMGDAGLAVARTRFGLDAMLDRMEEVFAGQAVEGTARPAG